MLFSFHDDNPLSDTPGHVPKYHPIVSPIFGLMTRLDSVGMLLVFWDYLKVQTIGVTYSVNRLMVSLVIETFRVTFLFFGWADFIRFEIQVAGDTIFLSPLSLFHYHPFVLPSLLLLACLILPIRLSSPLGNPFQYSIFRIASSIRVFRKPLAW
jgi:hypothetical protein